MQVANKVLISHNMGYSENLLFLKAFAKLKDDNFRTTATTTTTDMAGRFQEKDTGTISLLYDDV